MTKPDALLLCILVAFVFFTAGHFVGWYAAGAHHADKVVWQKAYYCPKKDKP